MAICYYGLLIFSVHQCVGYCRSVWELIMPSRTFISARKKGIGVWFNAPPTLLKVHFVSVRISSSGPLLCQTDKQFVTVDKTSA